MSNQENSWIKTSNQKPEEDERVLVSLDGEVNIASIRTISIGRGHHR